MIVFEYNLLGYVDYLQCFNLIISMKKTQNEIKQEQSWFASKNNLIPLLKIPQAHLQIYSQYIVAKQQILTQPKTADTGEFTTIDDTKLEQASNQHVKDKQIYSMQINTSKHKLIMFNNPDFAFFIDQSDKRVEIHDIVHHCIPLKFKVSSLQNLLTVQSLLRRKMCQLGFDTRYRLVKLLGKGATAEVQLVQRISDKKLFAAKIISIKDANDKSYSKLLRILRHKNIINLQSLYVHKKQLIQLMEYLSGGTLLNLVKNDQITQRKEKWKILRDMTNALDYLRQRRIVHRDVKMQNILVRKNGDQTQYVLSDFGLASWMGQKSPIFQRCGTPGYIAPEVLNAPKGKPILSHKADIFSLGIIAHILFLHQPLFPYTGNVKQLLKANKRAEYSLEGYQYQELSLSEMAFLQMTLEKKPQQRGTSQQILHQIKYIAFSNIQMSSKKSQRNSKSKQRVKIDTKAMGVQIQVKKAASLTKNKINLQPSRQQKNLSADKMAKKEPQPGSARKFISDVWTSLVSPSSKKQRKQTMKIKQNSQQKHKRLTQYF